MPFWDFQHIKYILELLSMFDACYVIVFCAGNCSHCWTDNSEGYPNGTISRLKPLCHPEFPYFNYIKCLKCIIYYTVYAIIHVTANPPLQKCQSFSWLGDLALIRGAGAQFRTLLSLQTHKLQRILHIL